MSGDKSSKNHQLTYLGTTVGSFYIKTQGAAIQLPGSVSALITSPDSADWLFSGDFTIEVFDLKCANNTAVHGIVSQYNGGGGASERSWAIMFDGANAPKRIRVILSTDGANATYDFSVDFAFLANTAYDLCVERSGSTLRIYVDGVMLGSTAAAGALFNSAQQFEIGLGFQKTQNPWQGEFTAMRITKGVARYASDGGYSVPSLPLPTAAP